MENIGTKILEWGGISDANQTNIAEQSFILLTYMGEYFVYGYN